MQGVEYKQLTDIEHALERRDMYIGNDKDTTAQMFVYNMKSKSVEYTTVTYNAGILKLFDEVFTNAIDNIERGSDIKNIDIKITKSSISVRNDGKNTIEIKKVKTADGTEVYIPELIFTRLRSGSNFDDTKQRTYGGRNGIGSKLATIFSTYMQITVCNNKTLYKQEVFNNCNRINKPEISQTDQDDFVMIYFKPDFKRFGITNITEDTYKVLCKRVHDCSHLNVKLTINNKIIPYLSWNEYVLSYPDMSRDFDKVITYIDNNSRWKIALTTSVKGLSSSTVNYVNTISGGTHVDYIIDQVKNYINDNVKPVVKDNINNKSKVKSKTKPKLNNYTRSQVESHMFVIVSAIIVNPEFIDQAKTKLKTDVKEFKDKCIIPENILKTFVSETTIIDELEQKAKTKLLNSSKKKINQIEKYIKANKANPKEGYKCTLFICEGLSAKTMCVTGMNIIGYDYFGVYPLRGKVLNTRNASLNKYCENREIQDLISIIGLEHGKEYTDTKGLNYGKIVCMKDADSDGADIMGLVMNFFEYNFKSLVKIPNFFNEFITPMIQIVNKKNVYDFYNEVQYKQFINTNEFKNISVRFIKGLASNTKTDIDKYFNNYDKYLINIIFDNNFEENLDKAFNIKRANDRKDWMTTITPDTHLPRESGVPIHVDDFIDKELVLYSMDACVRAIPSVIDGLKPVQRKILYTMFNESSIHKSKEIKVFQLCGNVGKFANYHHGDMSLNAAIIKMAQTYPGSNNIALLENSSDGFGTRQENGNDCGQPRYLMIKSNTNLSRLIFPAIDDNVIAQKIEDNEKVEPEYYIPIIPMLIINGATGIGMGWSTTIPLYSVKDTINYVKAKINKQDLPNIGTWYRDYDGQITATKNGYIHSGIFTINRDVVHVTEIPIDMSISQFRESVVKVLMLDPGETITITSDTGIKSTKQNTTEYHIKDCKYNTSRNVNHIDVELYFDKYPGTCLTIDGVRNVLHMTSNISTTNMVAFNKDNYIRRYENIYNIVNEWFDIRYDCYVKRKLYMINELEAKIKLLQNKVKFIKENIDETIDYKNKSDTDTNNVLKDHGYELIKDSYDYLLNMQIRTFTKDKYCKLCQELKQTLAELEKLKITTENQMWLNDINELEEFMESY